MASLSSSHGGFSTLLSCSSPAASTLLASLIVGGCISVPGCAIPPFVRAALILGLPTHFICILFISFIFMNISIHIVCDSTGKFIINNWLERTEVAVADDELEAALRTGGPIGTTGGKIRACAAGATCLGSSETSSNNLCYRFIRSKLSSTVGFSEVLLVYWRRFALSWCSPFG